MTLLRVHRAVALGLGGFVVLVTLAGALLVFRAELTPVFTPQAVVAARALAPDAYQRMFEAARRLEPSAVMIEVVPALRADRATELIVQGPGVERDLLFDPHDARLVADSERQWMPFFTLFRFHKQFLAGDRGQTVVGAVGVALAFLAVSGLVLWRPRAWRYAFRLRLDGNRAAVSFDVHRLTGVAFAALLLVNAIIGIAMAWDNASVRVVDAVARWQDPLPRAAGVTGGAMRPLDTLVAAANAAMPQGRVARIAWTEGAPVVVRKVAPGENDTHGMNRIQVDPASGTVLQVRKVADLGPGRAMFEWMYPLHTGTLAGTPYRALLVLAGLAPLLSLATGVILWRSRARKSAPAAAPARGTMSRTRARART